MVISEVGVEVLVLASVLVGVIDNSDVGVKVSVFAGVLVGDVVDVNMGVIVGVLDGIVVLVGVGLVPLPRLRINCGAFAPDSREARLIAVLLRSVTAKLYVPLPVM